MTIKLIGLATIDVSIFPRDEAVKPRATKAAVPGLDAASRGDDFTEIRSFPNVLETFRGKLGSNGN